MNEEARIYLLKILKFNGDIEPLYELNYSYSQIVDLINDEIKNGNAQYVNGILGITKQGDLLINSLTENIKNNIIEPEIQSKISVIEKNFIFLPSQEELTFMIL